MSRGQSLKRVGTHAQKVPDFFDLSGRIFAKLLVTGPAHAIQIQRTKRTLNRLVFAHPLKPRLYGSDPFWTARPFFLFPARLRDHRATEIPRRVNASDFQPGPCA